MSSNRFETDKGELALQVEDDHVYVLHSGCCGCGEEMTDMAEVAALHKALGEFLERNVSQR